MQLKDSLSALIEWLGGPMRKANSMTTASVFLLCKLEQQSIIITDRQMDKLIDCKFSLPQPMIYCHATICTGAQCQE